MRRNIFTIHHMVLITHSPWTNKTSIQSIRTIRLHSLTDFAQMSQKFHLPQLPWVNLSQLPLCHYYSDDFNLISVLVTETAL